MGLPLRNVGRRKKRVYIGNGEKCPKRHDKSSCYIYIYLLDNVDCVENLARVSLEARNCAIVNMLAVFSGRDVWEKAIDAFNENIPCALRCC